MSECKRQFLRGNGVNLAATVVALAAASFMNVFIAFIMKTAIEAMELKNWDMMNRALYMTGLFMAGVFLFGLANKRFKNRFILKALTQYKQYVFGKVLEKPIGEFSGASSGRIISAFSNDLGSIETNFLGGGLDLIYQCLMFLAAVAAMLYLNPILSVCVLASAIIPALLTLKYGGRLTKRERETSDRNEGFVGQVKDLLSGFVVIKSFKAEREVMSLFDRRNIELEDAKRARRDTGDTVGVISTFSSVIVIVVIFTLGAYFIMNGKMSIGAVLAFVQLSNFLTGPIERIVPLRSNFKAAGALVDKLDSAVSDANASDKKRMLAPFSGSMTLENVTYSYDGGAEALKNVSAEFEKGKSYAIVGGSGSGKSTVVKLLTGYFGGYSGSARIDGLEVRDIDLGSLYDQISVIQQDVFLFDESLESNITMFKSFPKVKLDRAVELAGLKSLVDAKGLGYACGEGGANLSGGEQQRVSIARSLLRETPVLIMDEATAALDSATAGEIVRAILDISSLTRIVVTHRLDAASLKRYDEIIAMRSGEIVERGTFDSLMSQKGYFYSLYNVSL